MAEARRVLVAGGGTGGHLMPALAIAATLRDMDHTLEPVLVGAVRGVEADILPQRDFRYHLLPSEPIYRRQWWRNARWPFLLYRLRRRVLELLDRERPCAVIGTGGYASGPVVWWAQRRGLPTAIQEQNAYPGLATRWLAPGADHLYLGLPEARAHLKTGRNTQVFDTGNPVQRPEFTIRDRARQHFGLENDLPTVLVTGGSQGSLALNRVVARWVESGGAEGINLLWVSGKRTHGQYAKYHSPPHIHVIDFLDPMALGYAVAHLVVSRSGAVTVAELCAWGLPSLLVPLPTAAANHQVANAEAMARAGAAWFLPQSDLTVERFAERLGALLADPEVRIEMSVAANERGRPNAARDIAGHITGLIERDRLSQVK